MKLTLLKSGLERLLEALLPPRCLLCGAPGVQLHFAARCRAGSRHGAKPAAWPGTPALRLPLDLCMHCRAALPAASPAWRSNACSRPYTDHEGARGALQARLCPWRYGYPVNALVRSLKFHGDRTPARVLGTLLAFERNLTDEPLPQLVLPMPLHARRLRDRGYNQAAEIAHYAARPFGLPVDARRLRRVRATREQSGLGAAARQHNVRGAFSVTAPMRGLHVALVDDVITTGATAFAAAECLRSAGAARVELWVLAQAGRRRRESTSANWPESVLTENASEHDGTEPGVVTEGL